MNMLVKPHRTPGPVETEMARRAVNLALPRVAGTLSPRWPDSHTTKSLAQFLALRAKLT